MLNAHLRALVLAPLLAMPGMVMAGGARPSAQENITVQASNSVQAWSNRVAERLDAGLTYPKPLGTADYHSGLSKVAFHCSDAGVPSDVTIAGSSGSRDLDQAAMRAVKTIPTLHPLPEGVSHAQSFQAWILFAGDEQERDRMLKRVQHDAKLANAAAAQRSSQTASSMPTVIVAAP